MDEELLGRVCQLLTLAVHNMQLFPGFGTHVRDETKAVDLLDCESSLLYWDMISGIFLNST